MRLIISMLMLALPSVALGEDQPGGDAAIIGSVVYPATTSAISCFDPTVLISVRHQVLTTPSPPNLDDLLQGEGCAMNGTDLAWQVIARQGVLAQVKLIAAPNLVMWFDTADLSDKPKPMPATPTDG